MLPLGDNIYRHACEAPGMQDDIEHSRNRWLDQEELRARLTGWGTNRQGLAILRNTVTSLSVV